MLLDVFTLCLLGLALQGCRGFGRKGQESQRHDQSGASAKQEQTERRDAIKAQTLITHESNHRVT